METSSSVAVGRLCAAAGIDEPVRAIAQRADALLDRVQRLGGLESLPVDIELLASFAGVTEVRDVPGLMVTAKIGPGRGAGELVIERRAEDSLARRRFSVGHEVGHTLFPDFWSDASACRPPSDDTLIGARADPVEELCEVAGAHLLMPTRLVAPFLRGRSLDMSTVVDLADAAQASLTASGRRLIDLTARPAAFVSFSPRHSKTQRRELERSRLQPALPGFDVPEPPQPKFRIDNSHGSATMSYLPREKSFAAEPFLRSLASGTVEEGVDEVALHGRTHVLRVSVLYAPVRLRSDVHDRFLAVVSPA